MEPKELGTETPTDKHNAQRRGNVITPQPGNEGQEGSDHSLTPTSSDGGDGRVTPPGIRTALKDIGEYEFDPTGEAERTRIEEDAIATALVMFSPTTAPTELPQLKTDTWPYSGREPNPITIGTARKLLGAAYAEIPCELEAAGDHGYAWIIEPEETWLQRDGVATITAPTKALEITVFDLKAQWEYTIKARRYTMYKHLMQEGKTKIMMWFGKEMFVDLFVNGVLPPRVTAQELLSHIAETYATPQANRICMEKVEEQVNAPYDPKKPVEAYFLTLQEAHTHATMLGVEYTNKQIMNKALKQFELQYEKDSYKAEKKWNERPSKEKTWKDFKNYWKNEIHQWSAFNGRTKRTQAHNAVDMESLIEDVSALQAETRSLQANNCELVRQLQFHQALQADRQQQQQFSQDDISTITDQLAAGIGRQLATESTRRQELLHTAANRNPRDYAHLNDGKGKRFSSYCWKCGCNCTHWTRKCLLLSGNERKKYRDADFDNLMGGSTKFLDRRGKHQSEFAFDSL